LAALWLAPAPIVVAQTVVRAVPPSASVAPVSPPPAPDFPEPAGRARAAQLGQRILLLSQRALTLPAHVWPVTKIAKSIAHGEPLIALTPQGAAERSAERAESAKVGVVIGRLSWELRDVWSVRGAERSYSQLIARLARQKAEHPAADLAVSLDPEGLGLRLAGESMETRTRLATGAILRLAKQAADAGLPVELDMGSGDALEPTVAIAHAVARELRVPVRLAIAARYERSGNVLREWAALARELKLNLGVRLVKGSFIEAETPDAYNERRRLLTHYKELITLALENADALDIAVASQNEEIFQHAQEESARLHAPYQINVIRGVNPALQDRIRAAGKLVREYVSYGMDAPIMGLMEMYTNARQKRALRDKIAGEVD
ncbi:MAG: proline dehydrogenase family protein, partial [Elusimicrobia bacterium]|nr:proline dehydrogenase family protein [Elusimicrobiota bacterium]